MKKLSQDGNVEAYLHPSALWSKSWIVNKTTWLSLQKINRVANQFEELPFATQLLHLVIISPFYAIVLQFEPPVFQPSKVADYPLVLWLRCHLRLADTSLPLVN